MTRRRGKLRTKLIIIFALVVAGPLFLTGLLLSLAARTSVQKAGRSLNGISSGSFREVAGNVSTTVGEGLQKAGKQLAQIGHQQLAELGTEQTRQSSEALRVAGKGLVKTGDVLLKQSNNEMIGASNEVVRQSGAKLRATHQDSINKVSAAMIVQAKDEFTKTGKELAQSTKAEFETLTDQLNEQRAKGLAEFVELFFATGDVKKATETAKTSLVTAESEAEVARILRDMRIAHGLVASAVAFSSIGEPIGIGMTEVNPRDVARWKLLAEETIEDKAPHNSKAFFLPVRDTMAITLSSPITSEAGDLRMVLIVDIVLTGIQRSVSALAAATKATVSIDDASGLVVAHSDSSLKGKPVPGDELQLLNEIAKIEQSPADPAKTRNTFLFGSDDDRQMCAFARVKPFGWTVLVRQPMKTVLATTTRIESAMMKRADVAAERMEKESNRLASQEVGEVKPLQDTIANDFANRLRAANERALSKAIERLDAEQKALTDKAVAQREAAAKNAAETAGRVMDEQATKAITETTNQVKLGTQRSVSEGLQRMSTRTAQSASQAARDMMKQSLLLLALFLVLAIGVAVATASSIVRPVYRLAEGAAAIAQGDYAKRVKLASRDEIGELAESFNSMAQAVQQSNEVISLEKSRLQAIVESTPDGLLTEDDEGRLTVLNAATLSLLMLPSTIPLNQPLSRAALAPEAQDRIDQCVAAAQSQGGVPKDFVIEGAHRHVLQVGNVAVADEGGRTHGRLIHLHDVSHEREMDQMKTDFVSMVSHELRTPLTSILGFSSYLLTGKLGELTGEQRTALEAMHRQSTRLKAIISDFLDISRIESGSIEMRREHVPVEEIAGRVIDELRPTWAEKGLTVLVSGNGNTPHLAIGDDQRIAQVFTNLLGNAIKFTEPGGNICVQVGSREREIVVEVVDNGIGIPTDELPKVFDRFYQVEKVVTRKTGGTGLGLAIVKNIVEAHGGSITVESKMGKGTTFRFTLAAAKKTRGL